jgi:hypothetical protein
MRHLLAVSIMLLSSTSAITANAQQTTRQVIELPLVSGWFNGRAVQYVTTDVSDPDVAIEMQANYVPRLVNALAQPGKPGAVERIYRVANFAQGSVLPSIPSPAGSGNRDRNYSPLWQVHMVHWVDNVKPHLLKSEEEILDAEEKGQLAITKTDVVVNCPVIFADGSHLPGARIKTISGPE